VDLVSINSAFAAQSQLKISDMPINCPSLLGLPTLVEGSVIPGEFDARLRLRNWVGQVPSANTCNSPAWFQSRLLHVNFNVSNKDRYVQSISLN
jgi:hypothetical protein